MGDALLSNSVFGPDEVYSAAHKFAELAQRWENRFAPHRQSLLEKYSNAEMTVVCDFEIISNKVLLGVSSSGNDPRSDLNLPATITFQANSKNALNLHVWNQEPMLVQNFEFMKTPDGFTIPSFVRLYRFYDQPHDSGRDLLFQSAIDSSFKYFPGFSYWKTRSITNASSVVPFNLTNRQIKGRSQVVKSISNENRKAEWDRLSYRKLQNIASAFRGSIEPKRVSLRCSKIPHFTLKILNVFIGPFNL